MADNNSKAAATQTVQTFAPTIPTAIIPMPDGYKTLKEMGADELKELVKRAGAAVEFDVVKDNPAVALCRTKMKRFVCSVVVKCASRKASFILGNEKPVVVSKANIDADYRAYTKAFCIAAKYTTMVKVKIKTFIREDESLFQRAYVDIADGAPIYAKEII